MSNYIPLQIYRTNDVVDVVYDGKFLIKNFETKFDRKQTFHGIQILDRTPSA